MTDRDLPEVERVNGGRRLSEEDGFVWSEELGTYLHPLADKFTCPKWDEPGECICGAALPPQSDWIEAGHQWQRVVCSACGRGYVDEDDFIAFYEPEYVAEMIAEDGSW